LADLPLAVHLGGRRVELNIAASARSTGKTHLRVAAHDEALYLDLGQGGKAVQISAAGWQIVDEPPVVFVSKRDMAPLPLPRPGGSLEELRAFVNVSEADFTLYLSFLLDALKGRKPYSIFVVNGEQGSAKSSFTVLTGELLAPCLQAKTKSLPDNRRDLAVMAGNRHLLAFDNISYVSEEMSDALCRVATGAGMVLRSLYSNDEEQVFGGANPVVLNGIPELGDRSDFLGRCVKITLLPIPDDQRIDEETLYGRFFARRP
jgi:hypothetical protein